MISALCLAFNYKNSESFLPGIIIDIYLFYRYCKSLNVRNIIIITDLEIEEVKISSHVQAIYKGYVDTDIIDFLDELKTNNIIVKFDYFNFTDQFKKILSDFNKNTNRLILYYSGHGIDLGSGINISEIRTIDNNSGSGPICSYFVFPDKSIMKIIDFQNLLLAPGFTDIVFLVDCCHLTDKDFLLPFKYVQNEGGFGKSFEIRKHNLYQWKCISVENTPNVNMLVITSTDIFNVSITSNNGSIFTRWILKILEEVSNLGCSRSLKAFYQKLSELYKKHTEDTFNSALRKFAISLNFQVLSSFPDVYYLPYWLFQYNKGRVCYEISVEHNYLILRNHYI